MRDDLVIFCAHVPTIPSSFVRMVLLVFGHVCQPEILFLENAVFCKSQRTDLASYEAIDELNHKAHTHVVQTRLKIGYQSKLAMLMTMLLLISMFMLMSASG